MASLYDPIPNSPFYSPASFSVSSEQGPLIVGTGLTVDQYGELLVTSLNGGTVTSVGTGVGLTGGSITTAGTISLVPATNISLGGIKVGANLLISPDGTLSAYAPGIGTITGVTAGTGLLGGGTAGSVTLSLKTASTTEFGGVVIGAGITSVGGVISLGQSTETDLGGIQIASNLEVSAGVNNTKAVTPATLSSKVASLTSRGIVQLSDNVSLNDSTKAATQTAAKAAYDAAAAAQATADAALPLTGGAMSGVITFAPAQTFPGVSFPVATTNSLGVIQVGPGLNVNTSGVLSTANNGTVTSVIAGPGLGAPASGNPITSSGTIRLLPPTSDGLEIGGVKAGANVNIAVDGTISTTGQLLTNNEYAFNSYIWPVAKAAPSLPCPGTNGQVLTIIDNVTGQLGWATAGTLAAVTAGTGISVTTVNGTATVSLSPVPTVVAGDYGATALIPTLSINERGQVVSTGQANPFAPFQLSPSATLDLSDNNLNWEYTLQGNTSIPAPINVQSGQKGTLLLRQNPLNAYVVTWAGNWKWANSAPFSGNPSPSGVDLIEFTVVSPTYVVVTNVVNNIG